MTIFDNNLNSSFKTCKYKLGQSHGANDNKDADHSIHQHLGCVLRLFGIPLCGQPLKPGKDEQNQKNNTQNRKNNINETTHNLGKTGRCCIPGLTSCTS